MIRVLVGEARALGCKRIHSTTHLHGLEVVSHRLLHAHTHARLHAHLVHVLLRRLLLLLLISMHVLHHSIQPAEDIIRVEWLLSRRRLLLLRRHLLLHLGLLSSESLRHCLLHLGHHWIHRLTHHWCLSWHAHHLGHGLLWHLLLGLLLLRSRATTHEVKQIDVGCGRLGLSRL